MTSASHDYLVVVYPAMPASRDMASQWAKSDSSAPRVKRVAARTPEAAAESAGVQAGEYALVADLSHVERFDRAKQAPLEQTDPSNGLSLPTAVAA